MSWQVTDDEGLAFFCDSGECDARVGFREDFAPSWARAKEIGWLTLKRTGRDWTHHCPLCAPQAERDHEAHKRNEAERERLKARNA